MGAYNRYSFVKRVYPNYLVILTKGKRLYSFDRDKRLLEYMNFDNNINKIKKKKINYLVLDNLDIVVKEEYKENMLDKYIYLMYMKEILNKIKVVISK